MVDPLNKSSLLIEEYTDSITCRLSLSFEQKKILIFFLFIYYIWNLLKIENFDWPSVLLPISITDHA